MRKLLLGSVVALALAVPAAARAGFIIEGSAGKGVSVSPDVEATDTNLMLAPGISVLSMLRLQLGLVAALGDAKASNFDLELRPMVTVKPPILPLYGRLILAFTDLTHSKERTVAYGGAVGLSFSLVAVGIFAEAGVLPRSINEEMWWVIEGRAGVSLGF
jgi:hypothetical protein